MMLLLLFVNYLGIFNIEKPEERRAKIDGIDSQRLRKEGGGNKFPKSRDAIFHSCDKNTKKKRNIQ